MFTARTRRCACAAWMLLALSANTSAHAEDVVAIEEHWELRVAAPDVTRNTPQVSMAMSPDGTLDGDFFIFTLNHRSQPKYSAGGLQVQHWSGGQPVGTPATLPETSLYHQDEFVTWTQRLSIDDGELTFDVEGSSQTWGRFGGDDLRYSISSGLESLNAYKPAISIGESGITFAGNRGASLKLQKLVWTEADGHEHELIAPIDSDVAPFDP